MERNKPMKIKRKGLHAPSLKNASDLPHVHSKSYFQRGFMIGQPRLESCGDDKTTLIIPPRPIPSLWKGTALELAGASA